MARYRRRDQVDARVFDEMEIDDEMYRVELTAKRATGFSGHRVTLAFIALGGAASVFVELDPAESRDEALSRAASLAEDAVRVRELFRREAEEAG